MKPYDEPIHDDYLYMAGKKIYEYEEFITDVDESGNVIKDKCDPLRSPFRLCYFRKDVLTKYYDDHENFSVEHDSLVRKRNDWYIPYGTNDENLVHVKQTMNKNIGHLLMFDLAVG